MWNNIINGIILNFVLLFFFSRKFYVHAYVLKYLKSLQATTDESREEIPEAVFFTFLLLVGGMFPTVIQHIRYLTGETLLKQNILDS